MMAPCKWKFYICGAWGTTPKFVKRFINCIISRGGLWNYSMLLVPAEMRCCRKSAKWKAECHRPHTKIQINHEKSHVFYFPGRKTSCESSPQMLEEPGGCHTYNLCCQRCAGRVSQSWLPTQDFFFFFFYHNQSFYWHVLHQVNIILLLGTECQ